LGSVHTLNLSRCDSVVDFSALGSVHTLDLSGCRGVVDVSALGSVHTLDLSGCRGVVDVSALGSVHTFHLRGCRGVVDVSALGKRAHVGSQILLWCGGCFGFRGCAEVDSLIIMVDDCIDKRIHVDCV
jgi:hypothetical protein